MNSAAPSAGQIALYVLLPIISFSTIVMVVYYCYRKRKCCFATKEEALLGNSEKNRFTVDMGKRKRRNNSITSNSWDSFETKQNDHYQHSLSSGRSQQLNNNYEKTIISSKIPRPDIKRSVVVGQASTKDANLLAGPYLPSRRATSPAQSLPDFNFVNPTTDGLYSRHYSYDASVARSSAYNTSEADRQHNLLDSKSRVFKSDENIDKKSPSTLRRLRHQGRVKGKENEPSFSRPTNKPRVSLVLTSASFELSSSEESDHEIPKSTRPQQIYSPSTEETRRKKQKQTKTKDVLQPVRTRKSSSSSDRGGRSPSTQYSGRSSPAILEAVDEVGAAFVRRSPNIRSRSSPLSSQQTSLDMNALQAALGQHRKSEGDVLARNPKVEDGNEQSEGLKRERTISQSSLTGGRRTGASNQPPNIVSPTLLVNTESYQGRQGRRRSSMQMPIDLSQINPRLYENMVKPPSMDFEDVDDDLPQVHFTLDYNHDLEVLNVKLIQARNLEIQAFSGTCDPYCTVTITPGFNARQSKVHRRTTDPEFGEKFAFSINQEDMRLKTLEIRTYDFDQFSRDECTGVMEMKLDSIDFEMTPHYDLWKQFRVDDLQASQTTETFGDLMLALSYLPSAEKLTVAIQKARNLKSPEGRKGAPDPYIKVSIFRGNQRLKKKKTDTIQSTYNPVFNQALTFSVSPELLQCPMMRITCQAVHDQKLAANADLGYLEIGPGSKEEEERRHWRDVTGKNSNKPVARWHKLHAPDTNAEESKGSFLNLANARRFSTTLSFQQTDKDSGKVSPLTGRRSLT